QKLAAELLKQIPKESFIQSRVPMADLEVARKLKFLGFKEIEQLITFETSISKVQFRKQSKVRLAVSEDRERVVEIARRAFSYSRFHQDPLIASGLADAIKADWTEAYFYGTRGSKMIVAVNKGEVSGFLLLIENGDKLVIDLIAVDKKFRGRGYASGMVKYVLGHAPSHINYISAGTQENNRASTAFYKALGFTPKIRQLTLHKHGVELD
ncbi:MAG: N-acetyltransferase family protein, partial [Candidatus Latescibacterota bacterium]